MRKLIMTMGKLTAILIVIVVATSTPASTPASTPTSTPNTSLYESVGGYLKIGVSADDTTSLYIGAKGALLPFMLPDGTAMMNMLMVTDVESKGHPKGEKYESLVETNCMNGYTKVLKFRHTKPGSSPEDLFPDDQNLGKNLIDALKNIEAVQAPSGSLIELLITVGCEYLNPPPPPSHQKLPDIEI